MVGGKYMIKRTHIKKRNERKESINRDSEDRLGREILDLESLLVATAFS